MAIVTNTIHATSKPVPATRSGWFHHVLQLPARFFARIFYAATRHIDQVRKKNEILTSTTPIHWINRSHNQTV
jgi:hypothetical protein